MKKKIKKYIYSNVIGPPVEINHSGIDTKNQSHGRAEEEQEKPKGRRRWTLSIPVPTGP